MRAAFEHVLKRHPRSYTPEQKSRWYEAYERLGNVLAACEETGVPHSTAKSWLHRWRKRQAKETP